MENNIKSLILSDQMKKQFAMALPKHLTPDRFTRISLTAINKNPKLTLCTKESLLSCLLDCSQLGIEPDGRKAHLIPYKNNKTGQMICTLIIDYKGLVDMARRSGEISDIHADVVCENDEFTYSFGTESGLIHKPAIRIKGNPICAYSFVRLKDGSTSYEVMNVEEIDAIKKRSKASESGPWITDWAEMAKKTVFRRHAKWLPVSSEFQEAIDKDYDVPIDITATSMNEIEMPKAKKQLETKAEEVAEPAEIMEDFIDGIEPAAPDAPSKEKPKAVINGKDFMQMKSKYKGLCRHCNEEIAKDSAVYYSKTLGIYHVECVNVEQN